jgi:hypothetical protein
VAVMLVVSLGPGTLGLISGASTGHLL